MAPNIDYKGTLQKHTKNILFDLRFEDNGAELLSSLCNEINLQLVKNFERFYKAEPKIDDSLFYRCAKKAIENVFVGSIKEFALSEALKQLALHECGCLIFGDVSGPSKPPTRGITAKEKLDQAQYKQIQKFLGLFRVGVTKFASNALPSFNMDKTATYLLGLRIHGFAKIVSEAAATTYAKKEELQPLDVRAILTNYLGKDALKAANGEGSKWLLLYENGMLDFKARREIKTKWSNDKIIRESIFTSTFLPSIRAQLKEVNPNGAVDTKASKFLGHTLMDLTGYLAQSASEVCNKRKVMEMEGENLIQTVSLVLPEQLRQHALLKANEDVRLYKAGLLVYDREIEESKDPKAKKPVKKVKKHTKPKPTPKIMGKRRTKSKKPQEKRQRTKSTQKDKNAKRRRILTQTTRKKPGRINFSAAIADILPAVIEDTDVSLTRDTKSGLGNIIENAYGALVSHSISAADSNELGLKEIQASVSQLFPGLLKELADLYGLHVLETYTIQ